MKIVCMSEESSSSWHLLVTSLQPARHVDCIPHPGHGRDLIQSLTSCVAFQEAFDAFVRLAPVLAFLWIPFIIAVGVSVPGPVASRYAVWRSGTEFGWVTSSAREGVERQSILHHGVQRNSKGPGIG